MVTLVLLSDIVVQVASGGAADPDDEFLADWEPSTDQLCSAEQWKSRLADSGSEPDDDSDIDEDDKVCPRDPCALCRRDLTFTCPAGTDHLRDADAVRLSLLSLTFLWFDTSQ